MRKECLACGRRLADSELYKRHRICPHCRFHYSLSASERIGLLADANTFRETNQAVTSGDPIAFSTRVPYKERLSVDKDRTGLAEAVVTGRCFIGGLPVMLIVLDFSFLGGSMGVAVGEKVARAFEFAALRKLPVVAVVTSGGSRYEEGVLSLLQMAKTAMAASQLQNRNVPFITVLANPATGQAYASFANLADILIAEPGALVGLGRLRAVEESTEEPLPQEYHTAEAHLAHGLIDRIADRESLKDLLALLLDLLMLRGAQPMNKRVQGDVPPRTHHPEAWQMVELARHGQRPTAMDYILCMFSNFVELHGDRLYGDDKSIICGLGYLAGQSVVVIGQERGIGGAGDPNGGRTYPEGLRKAQRGMRLAAKFQLPVITLIDTPGANQGVEAEERGIGNAIAATMAIMAELPVPTISAIVGEGGSEGALALGVADRVLMLENAIYSPISPEDAASLLYRDTAKANEVAGSLKLTAEDCETLGIVDMVVPEPQGGAHTDPDGAARHLQLVLLRELSALQSTPVKRLLRERYLKFRKVGNF